MWHLRETLPKHYGLVVVCRHTGFQVCSPWGMFSLTPCKLLKLGLARHKPLQQGRASQGARVVGGRVWHETELIQTFCLCPLLGQRERVVPSHPPQSNPLCLAIGAMEDGQGLWLVCQGNSVNQVWVLSGVAECQGAR